MKFRPRPCRRCGNMMVRNVGTPGKGLAHHARDLCAVDYFPVRDKGELAGHGLIYRQHNRRNVLDAWAQLRGPLGGSVREVAASIGVPRSTLHRLLTEAERARDPRAAGWRARPPRSPKVGQ